VEQVLLASRYSGVQRTDVMNKERNMSDIEEMSVTNALVYWLSGFYLGVSVDSLVYFSR
jgi:hypothetical protein